MYNFVRNKLTFSRGELKFASKPPVGGASPFRATLNCSEARARVFLGLACCKLKNFDGFFFKQMFTVCHGYFVLSVDWLKIWNDNSHPHQPQRILAGLTVSFFLFSSLSCSVWRFIHTQVSSVSGLINVGCTYYKRKSFVLLLKRITNSLSRLLLFRFFCLLSKAKPQRCLVTMETERERAQGLLSHSHVQQVKLQDMNIWI